MQTDVDHRNFQMLYTSKFSRRIKIVRGENFDVYGGLLSKGWQSRFVLSMHYLYSFLTQNFQKLLVLIPFSGFISSVLMLRSQ